MNTVPAKPRRALYRGNCIASPDSLSALLLTILDAVAMLSYQVGLLLICCFNFLRKTLENEPELGLQATLYFRVSATCHWGTFFLGMKSSSGSKQCGTPRPKLQSLPATKGCPSSFGLPLKKAHYSRFLFLRFLFLSL